MIKHCDNLSLDNIEGEVWKDIIGYEKFYQISNKGRIKTKPHSRWYASDFNHPERKMREKKYDWMIKKQTDNVYNSKKYPNRKPYKLCFLRGEIEDHQAQVHRIVAIHFVPNPENKPQVNHKNGIRWDNSEENLEWNTKVENERHAWAVLKRQSTKGEKHGKAKLKETDIPVIRKLLVEGVSMYMVAKRYSVAHATIWHIAKGRAWRHVA